MKFPNILAIFALAFATCTVVPACTSTVSVSPEGVRTEIKRFDSDAFTVVADRVVELEKARATQPDADK